MLYGGAAHMACHGSDEDRASETGAADAEARAAAAAARAEKRLARVHVSQPYHTAPVSSAIGPCCAEALIARDWRICALGRRGRGRGGCSCRSAAAPAQWAPLRLLHRSLLRLALCFVHSLTVR